MKAEYLLALLILTLVAGSAYGFVSGRSYERNRRWERRRVLHENARGSS